MNQFEKMSPEKIAKRYGLFRAFRLYGAIVFILFIGLDLFTIGYSLCLGEDLSYAFDYCKRTALFGVMILLCELWFCLRDVAVRSSLSKIGRACGDYEKSKRVYEILVKKTKNKKLKNYFRYMLARDCAALKEYDEAEKVLNEADDKHMQPNVKHTKYQLLESIFFSREDYEAFKNIHQKTTEAGKELAGKKTLGWTVECWEKLFRARNFLIDKDYENAQKAYDETLQLLRQKGYSFLNSFIAEVSFESAKISYEMGNTDDAYHKARTAIELDGSGSFVKEAEELLKTIKE